MLNSKELIFKGVEHIIKYCKDKDVFLIEFNICPLGNSFIRFEFSYDKSFLTLDLSTKSFNFKESFVLDYQGNFKKV